MVQVLSRFIDVPEVNAVNVLTDRVKKRREDYQAAKMHVCSERIRLVTESWKETDGQPTIIRWAKAFQRVMEEHPIVIWDSELIVGSATKYVRGACPPLDWGGEAYAGSIKASIQYGYRFAGVEIAEEDAKSLKKDLKYWKDKSTYYATRQLVHRLVGSLGDDYCEAFLSNIIELRPPQGHDIDYEAVINLGLNAIIAQARDELTRLTECTVEQIQKVHFLEAAIIVLEGAIRYAKRHAELARELAKNEADVTRKQELERIAEVCEWVPANPARTFQEALQATQFMLLGIYFEGHEIAESVGRIDQYLYPLYENDIREGRITRQEAAELLACFWIKLLEKEGIRDAYLSERAQGTQFVHVTIGGVRPNDGKDATNELTWLVLEVARQLKVHQPHLTLRYDGSLSDGFLIKAMETVRDIGAGIPQWVNDSVVIDRLHRLGVPIEYARNWVGVGCSHSFLSGRGHANGQAIINDAKIFELALNNGIDSRTGKRLGLSTGDAKNFSSIDEIYEAFKKQFKYVIGVCAKRQRAKVVTLNERRPIPFISVLTAHDAKDGTFNIRNARDIYDLRDDGSRLHQLSFVITDRGHVNIADSLVAIKKVVFEEKKATMAELLDALATNFKGKEDLRQMLLAAPKWGNDDDEADQMMKDVYEWTAKAVTEERNAWGYPIMSDGRHGTAYHVWAGHVVGALPDGRPAWTHLADGGVSPMTGMDKKGPTAVMNSVTKLDLSLSSSNVLNQKFPRSLLNDRNNLYKLLSLHRTYFQRGGCHIQCNVLDKETLLDAQKNPELHRDLLVRVAGYSARFVDLSREVQDEIIARTEQGL